MSTDSVKIRKMELLLANLLHNGTWVASIVTFGGMLLTMAGWRSGVYAAHIHLTSTSIIAAGIASFILLPVCRVVVMLITFMRERDYRFVAIAATVLAIIIMGYAVGLYTAKA